MVRGIRQEDEKKLVRNQLDTKSGNHKKCPVKTGFAVHPKPDWVSSQFRIQCPVKTGRTVQLIPDWVSSVLRIMQLTRLLKR